MSDFSGMHLDRPGLGDKMFDNAADHGPLTSISASPPGSSFRPYVSNRSSFDSIIDDEQRSQEDSLFERTHYRSSMSSDSVFNDDYPIQSGLLPPNQLFRPLSVHSIGSIHSPTKEDDTMISVSSIFIIFWLVTVLTKIYATDAWRRTCPSSIYSIAHRRFALCPR